MLILERFEENQAIIEINEGESYIIAEKSRLPANAREGDVLVEIRDSFVIDKGATDERKKEMIKKLRKIGL